MSKKIDYDRIVRDSFLKAQKDLGLIKEAGEAQPIQTKKLGSKAFSEYRDMEKLLAPFRAAAGVSGVASPEQFKQIVVKLNEILGMDEEKVLGFGTGVQDETSNKGAKADLSAVVSALSFYRTLIAVLKDQDPGVAGIAFENLIAVLFSGVTSGAHKPIEDVIAGDNYISIKAISRSGDVDGSISNLAKSLAESPNKKITYLVAVKDQSAGATEINFYSFVIDKNNFFQFIKREMDKTVPSLFDADGKITPEFDKFLKRIYKGADYSTIIKEELEASSILIRESIFTNLLRVKDINDMFSKQFLEKIFPAEVEYIDYFLASKAEKANLNQNLNDKPKQDKYIKALQDKRKELLDQAIQNVEVLTNEELNLFLTIAREKNVVDWKSKQDIIKYFEGELIHTVTGENKSIFNVSKSSVLEKIYLEVENTVNIENIINSQALVRLYDPKIENRNEDDTRFKNKMLELSDNYPFLKVLENVSFADLYSGSTQTGSGYTAIDDKAKEGRSQEKAGYISLRDSLDEEFDKRVKKYRKVFSIEKKKLLKPFLPILKMMVDFSRQFDKTQQQTKTAQTQITGKQTALLDELFGDGTKDGIFMKAPRASEPPLRFKYSMSTIYDLGIDVDSSYPKIFLNEAVLFKGATVNGDYFNQFVEPFNRNAVAMKEGWDDYIIQDDPKGLVQVNTSLKNIEKHLEQFAVVEKASQLRLPPEEQKSSLQEALKITQEAAIVMEMLKRMEE
jgi:hypothetical protein